MIKSNQKQLNGTHVLLDLLIISGSYLLSWFIMFGNNNRAALTAELYFLALVPIVPLYLLLYAVFGLYAPKRVSGRREEFANIIKANSVGVLIFTLILFMGSKNYYMYHFSRRLVFLFYVLNIILTALERIAIRYTLRLMRSKGYNQKHILLVGYSRAAESYIDRVLANPEWGYNVRGILDDSHERGFDYKGVKVIGSTDNLELILEMNVLDEIAVTLSIKEYENLEKIVNNCEKSGVHTKFIPDYNHMIPTIPHIEDLQGLPVINIRYVPLTSLHKAMIKRVVDIFGS